MDFATLFLYFVVMLACVGFTALIPTHAFAEYNNTDTKWWKFYVIAIVPIMIYTLFWGLRYDVGADYLAYKDIFENPNDHWRIEVGFIGINNVLKSLGGNYISIFVFTSAVNILSVYSVCKKKNKDFACFSIFFYYTTSAVFFAQNGIRQMLCSSLVLFLLSIIGDINNDKKRRLNSILIILFGVAAYFIHKSSGVVFVILLLLNMIPTIKMNKYIVL